MKPKRIISFIVPLIITSFIGSAQTTKFEFSQEPRIVKYNAQGFEALSKSVITLAIWENDWFVFDQNGRFDGSDGGLQRAQIIKNDSVINCSRQHPGYTVDLARNLFTGSAYYYFAENLKKRLPASIVNEIIFNPVVVVDPLSHTDEIMDLLYSESLNVLISLSKDKTIRLWDIETGENIRTLRTYGTLREEGQFYRAALSEDGKRLFAGGFMDKNKGPHVGDIKIYDLESGEILGTLRGSDNSLNSICYAKGIVVGGYNNKSIFIFTPNSIEKAIKEKVYSKTADKKFESDVSGVSLSPDGKTLVVSRYASKIPYLAEISIEGDEVKLINEKSLSVIHNMGLVSVAISPDGKYFLSADLKEVHLWDINGNHLKKFADVSLSAEQTIRFSTDGKYVVIRGKVYNFPDGTIQSEYRGEKVSFRISNFAGKNLVAHKTTDEGIFIWNVDTKKEHITMGQGSNIKGAVFLPKGLKIALSSYLPFDLQGKPTNYPADKNVAVFDFETMQLRTVNLPEKSLDNYHKYEFSGTTLNRYIKNGVLDFDIITCGSTPINHTRKYGSIASFTFTPEGNILIGTSLYLVLIDKEGREIRRFEGHSGGIESIALSPDGKFFVSYGRDRLICLWNLNDPGINVNGNQIVLPLARLFINPDFEWICLDSRNYYASSKKAARFVGFIESKNELETPTYYTFENFDLLLNRPDMVLKSLNIPNEKLTKGLFTAYQRRLKRYQMNISDLRFSNNKIDVKIINPSGKTENQNFKLKFNVRSSTAPIVGYEVYINDVNVIDTRLSMPTNLANEELNLLLSNGRNKIQVVAYDIHGNKSSVQTLRINYQPKIQKLPTLYFVSLAVSKYNDNEYNLTYPTKDATDLENIFKTTAGKFFGEIKTLRVHNQEATRSAIKRIKSFIAQSNVNDYVIIFVAGHGLIAGNNWYFATVNVNFEKPENEGIAYDELEELFNQIPARNRIMLIDACHSGGDTEGETITAVENSKQNFVKTRGFKSKTSTNELSYSEFFLINYLFPDLNKRAGAAVISAAAGAEFAFESDVWKNGVFTYSILEGLKSGNADLNQDKKITASELKNYVAKNVSTLTSGKQNPTSRTENLENDFIVFSTY